MAFDLTDGVAAITGAGSGIGRALALALAAKGMELALSDTDAEGLAETERLLASTTQKTTSAHVVDVSDEAAMLEWSADVHRTHGRVTICINNAGVAMYGTFTELQTSEIAWLMGINFWGVVHGTRAFLPTLLLQPRAALVNISSVFGLYAPPNNSAYAASKFAVRGFTESLRGELAKTNVLVSTVHPGGIKTAIAKRSRIARWADPNVAQRALAQFDAQALRTTPEIAATTIVKGIVRERERILIGSDARSIDRIVRLWPVGGPKWLNRRFSQE
jgi:short-subunit dehydrogenase